MIHLFVTDTGSIRYVYNEKVDMSTVGEMKIERFASVEPSVQDPSRWTVSILEDTEVFKNETFKQRSDALKAEELEVVRRLRNG